ncbi:MULTISPECIES: hypothetical protein [Sphingomonadaceae]|jgi:hypothetical protein|uniref:Uncharacterized protein n=1 Tax=Novosphingobium clariflavum TaxID=2029884 RepID=A0ABV6SAK0_9SPHN|nr:MULTISPECIES: hypothetical protein [Sphingomonadaceae]MBR2269621.1 hypothetical protein [Sphingobium sp.]
MMTSAIDRPPFRGRYRYAVLLSAHTGYLALATWIGHLWRFDTAIYECDAEPNRVYLRGEKEAEIFISVWADCVDVVHVATGESVSA